jgi:hypothetical protein
MEEDTHLSSYHLKSTDTQQYIVHYKVKNGKVLRTDMAIPLCRNVKKPAANVNRHTNLAQETEYTVKSLSNEFLEEWLFSDKIKVSTIRDYAECHSSSCKIYCIQL